MKNVALPDMSARLKEASNKFTAKSEPYPGLSRARKPRPFDMSWCMMVRIC